MVVLSWVSLCQDAAAEMLYPILPLFLTSALGAPPAVVGLVEGVAEATAAAGKAISGRLAGVRQRVPLVAWGYGISAVAKPMIGMATGWPLVLVARFLDRAGKGLRTSPRDALISAATGPASRGRAFGFHRAMDTAGAVIGPLLGLALYAALGHRLRPLFFIAFLPAVLSVALIKLVDEPPRAPDNRPPATKDPLPAGYWRVVGFLTLFGLANFSDALVILRVHALGLGVSGVLLGYVLYNVSYAGLSFPAGAVSDRVPRHLVFAGGMGVFAAAYTGLGVVTTHSWVWLQIGRAHV